jgi:Ser-tRNA(Ala) deacylase AlaX
MSLTELLHRTEPHLLTFTADVVAVREDGIVELRATAFYAQSGGQVGDTGTIADVPVLDTVYAADAPGVVHHLCDPDLARVLRPGTSVDATIDADRRHTVMRLHTAQHLLFLATEQVVGRGSMLGGGAISDERARIDVAWPSSSPAFPLDAVVAVVEGLIAADHDVERYPHASAPERWWWQIRGHDPVPCGGTHVARTADVGDLTITASRKGGKAVRVTAASRVPAP